MSCHFKLDLNFPIIMKYLLREEVQIYSIISFLKFNTGFAFFFSAKMTAAEQACYTLINSPADNEPPNEMQLRQDLGITL